MVLAAVSDKVRICNVYLAITIALLMKRRCCSSCRHWPLTAYSGPERVTCLIGRVAPLVSLLGGSMQIARTMHSDAWRYYRTS